MTFEAWKEKKEIDEYGKYVEDNYKNVLDALFGMQVAAACLYEKEPSGAPLIYKMQMLGLLAKASKVRPICSISRFTSILTDDLLTAGVETLRTHIRTLEDICANLINPQREDWLDN